MSWVVVREVISSTNDGAQVMSALPGLVRRLLDEEAWRSFTPPGEAHPIHYDTFTEFVAAAAPKGLGGKSAALLALCGADDELRTRVDRLLKGEIAPAASVGRPRKDSTTVIKPDRDTAGAVVARLKRDDPALAEKVVNGEMSAYAAARTKGWKPPRIQVTTPERTAAHLCRHMTRDQLDELVNILIGVIDG